MGRWDLPRGRSSPIRGRRGSMPMLYEALISALLIAIFIVAVFPYIFEHANGESYFSKFYAADLSTSAELVNAGYGDVVLRYDNLKPNLDLTFWFANGVISVAKSPVSLTTDTIVDTATAGMAVPKPPQATTGFYGKARQYAQSDALRMGESDVIRKPVFLVLRKYDGSFAITEAQIGLRSCPAVIPAVARKDAKVSIQVTGQGAERIEARAAEILQGMKFTVTDSDPNVRIALTWKNGDENSIQAMPTSLDGREYGCLFAQRLRAATLAEFRTPEPSSSGTTLDVQMTLTTKVPLTEEQIAQALANALAVYYR